ncbi:MAG: phosphoglycerate kinase [Desulfitobacteriia bacterium]|jgi:phosphoglycerate kinase
MEKAGIEEAQVQGKRVLVRVDFNVPMNDKLEITDDTRLKAVLPTIEYLISKQAKVILVSHLGRPKGKVDQRYSLKPVAVRLGQLLGQKVFMAQDCIGAEVKNLIDKQEQGAVILLENIRFYEEEEKNDADFARELASLADIYVNDAFGAVHRAHASTVGVTSYIPAYAGFLLKREIEVLSSALKSPTRPFTAIIGGAKVSDKIAVIENLLTKVDNLIIGGGMANTFFKAQGLEMGKSLVEEDRVELAREILNRAKSNGVNFLLPVDVVVAKEFSEHSDWRVAEVSDLAADELVLDIGPRSSELYAEKIRASKTVVWNGPMGVFEMKPFARGTEEIARALTECHGVTIVGGGDSAAAVQRMGVVSKLTHVSTGGGASLAFLAGKTLPGVAVLKNK